MSAPNILQSLSQLSSKADKIIENTEMTLGVHEWIKLVKARAMEIFNNDLIIARSESPVKIPNLVAFLNGPRERVSRVSAVLRQVKKDHLHPKEKHSLLGKAKGGTSESSRGSKSNSPSTLHLNTLNSTFVKSIFSENGGENTPKIGESSIKIGSANENTPKIDESSVKIGSAKKTPFSAKKKKRKSSTQLSNESKKPCPPSVVYHNMQPSGKSLRSAVLEKFSTAKNSSCLSNPQASMKSSIGLGANNSILKENRTLRKRDEKVNENLKNALAARKQKLEENKRKREEKMEKTQEKRIRLEKEKIEKLKSQRGAEKSVAGKILQPAKATPEIKKIKIALNENKGLGEIKNATIIKLKTASTKKNLFASVEKNEKPHCNSSSTRTPKKTIKRNQKHDESQLSPVSVVSPKGVTKNGSPNGGDPMNVTHVIPKSNEKIINKKDEKTFLKGANAISKCSNKEVKIAPTKKDKISVLHQKAVGSTPVEKPKKLESYEMTPARTSYVSYDISEIKSDSEDEEQEQQNSKPIPSWATGVRLRNALLQQFHAPIDTDELFGNYYEAPNLHLIMGVEKKHYNKRTSSAVWNSSFT